ncbi:hypothetical protein [Legionella spiritensis]|uniref:Uncharacterized protein n=1 Tax=Legionella spiritensis TaxID=452 RepID=A0A0W0Z2K2_LEGSP|nr:hypothetical protein [Legionella spiritensis]KTD63354.1 hypothetical protein Lspi_1680 [Legionella spiritensis]SNV35406.1 Uncharacterised protein [Legionella spiritensis]VEG89752.1 Uncharacterised protein [Legionella spiritensis]
MEPVTIAIICASVFGVVGILAAFIRQLLLSRDKNLNDQAQQRALDQEARELEKLRLQMSSNKRFDSHYQVLGSNKEAIQYLDQKIDEILRKKEELIQRYAQVALKESSSIVSNGPVQTRKDACDELKQEISKELARYDGELEKLQTRRASLWDNHFELQNYLLEQEKQRNEHMDSIFERHSGLLEKIYLRHNHNSENIAKQTIDSSTQTFKSALMAPIEFLLGFFKISTGINLEQSSKEKETRQDVSDTESDINDLEDDTDSIDYDDGWSDDETLEDYRKKWIESPA